MLSVLIPVKDWNPYSLVESLVSQLVQCGHPFEILISDDSTIRESHQISQMMSSLPCVTYFCREAPLGRSANRNFLGDHGKYSYFLFIDGDAGMSKKDYIQSYIDRLSPDSVLCGGTLYSKRPPENQDFMLRWKYGSRREQLDASIRQMKPWKSFSTFNFLIPSEVFRRIRFNESITGYGHEDTYFGIKIHQSGIKLVHLDNGLYHLGLEPSQVYLGKILKSGANLHFLYSSGMFPAQYSADISLLAAWKKLKRYRIAWLAALWFRYCRRIVEKRLCGRNPSLLLLDLYKLGAISYIG